MEVTEIGCVSNYGKAPEKSIHHLIEQLKVAVKNQQADVDQLIGALQNRCLTAKQPLHPHINELVTIFIDLSTRERPKERYHLAQVLALWVHKSALHQPVEFNRILEGDWQRIRNMKGQHMLLDLYLDCLWGSYWRLCYPQDKLSRKEIALLFGRAGLCSYKASKGQVKPTVEYAMELRERIREIPPDWTHKASVYLQWGHEPGRYKNLLVELEQLLDERSKKDAPLMVAMAHAFGTVVARRDVDSISACDRLKTLACLGKKDKPCTNAFGDVRYHAWSLLFSLGPQWNYTDELMKQRGLPEKVPEVLTLLMEEHAAFPCAPATTIAGDHFPPMNAAIIEESGDLRTALTRGLVEVQNGVIQVLRNQQIIMVHLDEAKWERYELKRMIGRFERRRLMPVPRRRITWGQRCAVRDIHRSNTYWYRLVCSLTIAIPFKSKADYQLVWKACCQESFEHRSFTTNVIGGLYSCLRANHSTTYTYFTTALVTTAFVVCSPLVAGLEAIAPQEPHTALSRCDCTSCCMQRFNLFLEGVKHLHPELRPWSDGKANHPK